MLNNLGLSFGLIIALFIPGVIICCAMIVRLLGLSSFDINDFKNLFSLMKESYLFIIFLISVFSLIIGLLLDGVRYIITWFIQYLIHSKIDIAIFRDEDMKYHDWIIEHSFRFHQFYANLCLGLLVSILIFNGLFSFYMLCLFYFFSIVCFISSILSYKKVHQSLIERVNLIKKEAHS